MSSLKKRPINRLSQKPISQPILPEENFRKMEAWMENAHKLSGLVIPKPAWIPSKLPRNQNPVDYLTQMINSAPEKSKSKTAKAWLKQAFLTRPEILSLAGRTMPEWDPEIAAMRRRIRAMA
tara:strand:+ start:25 stop:390 length:366 start_codon:yes stop_codon:yes gene_type:complete